MSSEVVIRVENLSKYYHVYATPYDRFKQFVLPAFRGMLGRASRNYFDEFRALSDVSFDIKKGEVVGIIGRNGSGKSTLLQLICGTLSPTGGLVQTQGRIAALLELGSGFNPEFSGRENVYLNAAILGLSKEETDRKYDEILAFADIGDFIARPVKTYSSGMIVRLAFAVASCVDPDILVVDEALAVGDIAFQHKCFTRIRDLRARGATILFVSHDLGSVVEFCDRAYVMNSGRVVYTGTAAEAVNSFKKMISFDAFRKDEEDLRNPSVRSDVRNANLSDSYEVNQSNSEYGSGAAVIYDWGVRGADGSLVSSFESRDVVEIEMFVRFNRFCANPIIGYFISDSKGREIVGTNSAYEGVSVGPRNAGDEVRITFRQALRVSPGEYFLNLGCSEYAGDEVLAHHRLYQLTSLLVFSMKQFVGFCRLDTAIDVEGLVK